MTSFRTTILDTETDVLIEVNLTYTAILNFTVCKVPYGFVVTKWSSRGLAQFLDFFHLQPRDPEVYGRIENGEFVGDFKQKTACVVQACKDIMTTLNKIIKEHPRTVLEYAIWYSELYSDEMSYSDYITIRTCECIINNHFTVGNVVYKVVKF